MIILVARRVNSNRAYYYVGNTGLVYLQTCKNTVIIYIRVLNSYIKTGLVQNVHKTVRICDQD